MRHIEKEIDKLVYDEYGDILDKKDKKIETQANEITKLKNTTQEYKNTNQKYKNQLQQLNELKNLTPEAKKIINAMLLL